MAISITRITLLVIYIQDQAIVNMEMQLDVSRLKMGIYHQIVTHQ